MHILFLDMDGVFTNARTGWHTFDITAINFIRWVCEQADVKLVISSTWRHSHSKAFFETIFGEHLHNKWKTPVKLTSTRGDEIAMWLRDHQWTKKGYTILDDDTDIHSDQKPNFIKCNSYEGLLSPQYFDILRILKIKTNPWDTDGIKYHIHPNMFSDETELIIEKGKKKIKKEKNEKRKPNFT